MTREITTCKKSFQHEAHGAHTGDKALAKSGRKKASGASSFLGKISTAYSGAVKIKRELSEKFVALTEALADKTAREGLFGEDKGKGYAGTDKDYLS